MSNDDLIKTHFVAFIDILGFKALVNGDRQHLEKSLALIRGAVEHATIQLKSSKQHTGGPYKFWFDEFKIKSFSDCFCFSVPLEFENGEKDYKQNLLAFCIWIDIFCTIMLMHGFLCRGGITQGFHYADDDLIFSPAQIAAYKLESEEATHPIIMVHDDLIRGLVERSFNLQPYYPLLFAHDRAGRSFLNPFNYTVADQTFFGPHTEVEKRSAEKARQDILKRSLEVVTGGIEKGEGKVYVEKWQWMKEFLEFVSSGAYSEKYQEGLWIA